jgi:hypothetical protein
MSLAHEPETRINHQRRTHHQHSVGILNPAIAFLYISFWHRIAEKHHVWLHYASTFGTLGNLHPTEVQLNVGIAIWRWSKTLCIDPWVLSLQPILDVAARLLPSAIQAPDLVKAAVQIQHLTLPSTLMQTIHILGDDCGDLVSLL